MRMEREEKYGELIQRYISIRGIRQSAVRVLVFMLREQRVLFQRILPHIKTRADPADGRERDTELPHRERYTLHVRVREKAAPVQAVLSRASVV